MATKGRSDVRLASRAAALVAALMLGGAPLTALAQSTDKAITVVLAVEPDSIDSCDTQTAQNANVVLGNGFGIPGLPVDTHVLRLSNRLGYTTSDDPVQVEKDVTALLPKADWVMASHHLIFHGRRTCFARKPACGACPVFALCPSAGIGETDPVKAAKLVKP